MTQIGAGGRLKGAGNAVNPGHYVHALPSPAPHRRMPPTMDPRLADLLNLLKLERLEMNLFRGASSDIGSPQVFGGQVPGQALMAATATVEARTVHSLHAYFLRPGDFNAPIVYD